MSASQTHPTPVVILGGGPAGLGAAYRLARRGGFQVTVLERAPITGGNAGSFDVAGLRVDYGSHRLHPSCSPAILADIRGLLGEDLLDRPRHGRIRLRGRWVHFPLKPADLVLNLPPSFVMGVLGDKIAPAPAPPPGEETFASLLEKGLGRTICRDFYFPYAGKIWGLKPEELDAEQARRRVSASSIFKLVRKVLNAVPGFKPAGSGRFFYPRHGFGQISDAYEAAAEKAGATVHTGQPVTEIGIAGRQVTHVRAGDVILPARTVLSTIPLTLLAKLARPAAPPEVLQAAGSLRYRSMILIYLILGKEQYTEYDAHYFPEAHIPVTRLSEPKNYGLASLPGKTVLCFELPCEMGDRYWNATDEELGKVAIGSLRAAGLPADVPVTGVEARRLGQAYPIYNRNFRPAFEQMDAWASSLEGLVTMGRQGLFAHDNTHHTLAMAYAAVDCLDANGAFDRGRWAGHRREFESHIVED